MPAAQPVTPVIQSVSDLLNWQPTNDPFAPFNQAFVPLVPRALPATALLQNCQGLAAADYPPQGSTQPLQEYAFTWWPCVDNFTFFGAPGGAVIGIPSPGWTNAAHRNGVPMLGCIFANSPDDVRQLVKSSQRAVTQLINVAMFYKFDGWFFNIEQSTDAPTAQGMIALLRDLTTGIHQEIPGSLVLWYDAMDTDGYVSYQNQLDAKNAPFMDACDGLFTNYAWSNDGPYASPQNSVAYAKEHGENPLIVYTGVDCYGRQSGNTGFQTFVPSGWATAAGTSVGLFCPGWTWQNAQTPLNGIPYPAGEDIFWNPIANLVPPRAATSSFPFVTHFDQGFGWAFVVQAQVAKSALPGWTNMSQQDILPSWRYAVTAGSAQSCNLQLGHASPFDGGGNLQITGDPTVTPSFATYRLFAANLTVGSDPLTASFTYTPSLLTAVYPVTQASVYPDVAIALLFDDKSAVVLLSGSSSPCNGQSLGSDGYTPAYMPPTSTVPIPGAGAAATSPTWTAVSFELGTQYQGRVITEIRLLAAWTSGTPDPLAQYVDWSSVGEIKLLSGTPPALGAVTNLAAQDVSWSGSTATLNLTWDAPAGTTVRHYDIYANGQWIGRGFANIFWVAAAQAGNNGSVTFTVRCADIYGQFEEMNSSATVTISPS